MTQFFSFKSAAMLCVATLAMCCAGQDANAQCRGGGYGGFSPGYGGISIGYSSGYRGGYGYNGYRGGYGNYGRGVSVNLYRPSYGPSWHGGSYYSGRRVPYGNHFNYVPGHSSFYRGGHHRHH